MAWADWWPLWPAPPVRLWPPTGWPGWPWPPWSSLFGCSWPIRSCWWSSSFPGPSSIQRVGGDGTNLSVADLLVFVGALVCLFHVAGMQAPHLRRFLGGSSGTRPCSSWSSWPTPSGATSSSGSTACRMWAAACWSAGSSPPTAAPAGASGSSWPASSVLALFAMEHAVTLHFQPAQWGVYQKNAIGAVMWIAIVIAQINPSWTGIAATEARVQQVPVPARAACLPVAAGGHPARLGLGYGGPAQPRGPGRVEDRLIFSPFRPSVSATTASPWPPRTTRSSTPSPSGSDQIGAAVHVWHLSPWLGWGLRFYNLPQFVTVTAPPNVTGRQPGVHRHHRIDRLLLHGRASPCGPCAGLPYAFGSLGLVVLVAHYVDGLFDIFWIGRRRSPRSSSPASPWAWPTST